MPDLHRSAAGILETMRQRVDQEWDRASALDDRLDDVIATRALDAEQKSARKLSRLIGVERAERQVHQVVDRALRGVATPQM